MGPIIEVVLVETNGLMVADKADAARAMGGGESPFALTSGAENVRFIFGEVIGSNVLESGVAPSIDKVELAFIDNSETRGGLAGSGCMRSMKLE